MLSAFKKLLFIRTTLSEFIAMRFVWIFMVLVSISGCGERPAGTELVVEVNKERAESQEKCKNEAQANKKGYDDLMIQEKYWEASMVAKRCMNLLESAELKSLAEQAEILEYQHQIKNEKLPALTRLDALKALSKSYPNEAAPYASMGDELGRIAKAQEIPLPPPKPATEWRYEEVTDGMTDSTMRMASIVSGNSLSLDFPYQGNNPGTITVRRHPRHGLDVMVSIRKGQILCQVTGCMVNIRFDDDKSTSFRANGPADHSSEVVFLEGASSFIARAKRAKRIRVLLPLYQAGEQLLEFSSPVPLEWETSIRRKVR